MVTYTGDIFRIEVNYLLELVERDITISAGKQCLFTHASGSNEIISSVTTCKSMVNLVMHKRPVIRFYNSLKMVVDLSENRFN